MDSKKKQNLEETYERIINVGLCIVPYEDLSGLVAPELMLFGTTKDEKVFSFSELDAMFQSQYKQMVGFVPSLDRNRLFTRFSNDGNNAFITEEVTLTITSPEEVNTILIRCSCVMEYIGSQWKLTHWHASTPVETENDHWHMEEWKREKEKLQQLVDQQTADLKLKNRELEIEASIERVRAVAMGMTKPDDMLDVCRVISDQLHHFGVGHIRNVQTVIINEKKGTYHNYQYFSAYDKESVEVTEYHKSPVVLELANRMLESADGFFTGSLSGSGLAEFRAYRKQENQFPDPLLDEADAVDYHFFSIGPGGLGLTLYRPLNEEALEIFKRFHNVFSLAYRRFRDIEKAEAQAREAQIEAALERVRSRSLAMHKTDELQDVVRVVAEELKNTGVILDTGGAVICTYFQDSKDVIHWTATEDPAHPSVPYFLPYFKDELFDEAWESKNRGDGYFAKVYSYEVKNRFWNNAFELSDYRQLPEEYKKILLGSERHGLAWAWSKNSAIMIPSIQGDLPSEEEKELLIRFAKVFEQSFIRFLDLQKAEAQALEAQIEVALEKVRSRTMGMQSSDELPEVANLLFLEVQALGIPAWSCGYNILAEDKESATCWMSSEGTLQKPFQLRLFGEASFDEMGDFLRSKKTILVQELGGNALQEHYEHMKSFPDLKPVFDDIEANGLSLPTYQINHLCKFTQGFLLFITYEKVPECHDIFKRFTSVFDQTYTRFLDLKKAEAQAREAQIEAALERVRSSAMAMQSSQDLNTLIGKVFTECTRLDIQLDRGIIMIYDPETMNARWWMANPEAPDNPRDFFVQHHQHAPNLAYLEAWKNKVKRWTYVLEGEEKEDWDAFLFFETDLAMLPDEVKKIMMGFRTVHLNASFNNFGNLTLATLEPMTDSTFDILLRFARVFDLTYTRFNDLKQAEARAREATKQASLDRVRGEIASMRSAQDLKIITPLVWRELTTLGIPFIRCGVFIVHETEEEVEVYLSKPDGTSLAVMHLPFGASDLAIQTVDAWRNGRANTLHWTRQDFLKWGRTMVEKGQIPDLETYQGAEDAPESLHLHFIPFNQGMLYVGATEPLNDGETGLAASLAEAFSIAYARYEDFVKLEKAKAGIEEALAELKATQSQLVQQEKLASLGQLTAGIAHEIKNPLNFVNNFSEVSLEMIDEALEELQQIGGNEHAAEATAILADIKSNLAKIHEHGSRADGIVKSMLMHSRGGDGKMEPTPLNPLIKEYVNLAFHGMRAGKDPIDVDIDLQLDENVGDVPLVAEDFSRVILNLCTNAFDACAQRGSLESLPQSPGGSFESLPQSGSPRRVPPPYKPRLAIRTGKTNGTITIEIEDNGPGIPDDIKDKILQPFFTTKKGTQGTGLGLSITNDIIKAHGGLLEIKSDKNGTTMMIKLTKQE